MFETPGAYLSEKAETKCVYESEVAQSCTTLTARPLRPWDFPGQNTGVVCHFLLQGIFMTQELNLGLPHCRQFLYHLSHQMCVCPSPNLRKVKYVYKANSKREMPKYMNMLCLFLFSTLYFFYLINN